jgi:hypothetical protein
MLCFMATSPTCVCAYSLPNGLQAEVVGFVIAMSMSLLGMKMSVGMQIWRANRAEVSSENEGVCVGGGGWTVQ